MAGPGALRHARCVAQWFLRVAGAGAECAGPAPCAGGPGAPRLCLPHLFFDAAHGFDFPKKYNTPFNPYLDKVDYLAFDNDYCTPKELKNKINKF